MEDPKKLGPRDVFSHFFAIISLYFWAVNFGVILFLLLNLYLPDALADGYASRDGILTSIRWAVSMLVIVFPVYVGVSSFLEKELTRQPEKRNLRSRKWLIYLTLFLSALVIIGDLVTLVYSFLQGELTTRFVLKILVVSLIAGGIFRYYTWSLKENLDVATLNQKKIFGCGAIVLVAATIIGGFYTAGLPKSQRAKLFDERRVNDLQGVQIQILYFWQQKSKLPDTLDQLKDSLSGYQPPVDPETASPYLYEKTGDLKFKLCADFKTSGLGDMDKSSQRFSVPYPAPLADSFGNWQHSVGRVCFDRVIDPELYSVKSKFGTD